LLFVFLLVSTRRLSAVPVMVAERVLTGIFCSRFSILLMQDEDVAHIQKQKEEAKKLKEAADAAKSGKKGKK
jgi:Translation machinery associated TMA7